jgi:epoxyqueuosine reductase
LGVFLGKREEELEMMYVLEEVEELVNRLVREHEANQAADPGVRYFESPLVGVASGGDPLFAEYKKIIGDFHMTPVEALASSKGRSEKDLEAQDLSVICWILPVSEAVRAGNRNQNRYPSRLWAHCRQYGEQFNELIRCEVESYFQSRGIDAVAPFYGKRGKRYADEEGRILGANWSERHAVYAAGLGTFSLSDGLITERGIAMRCGSVVAALRLDPSPRTAGSHTDNCLFYARGTCGECIDRCPAGAITEAGHDKNRCSDYIDTVIGPVAKKDYGIDVSGCGLCQAGVPCESRNPI